jgi:hypothetical protein
MSNTATLYQLAASAQYERDGLNRVLEILKRTLGDYEELSDALVMTRLNPSSAAVEATAWTNAAVRLYLMHAASPAGATTAAFLQVFSTSSASVTLGTTRPDTGLKLSPGASKTLLFLPGNNDSDFAAGLSIAATTTAGGATGVNSTNAPVVTIVANK